LSWASPLSFQKNFSGERGDDNKDASRAEMVGKRISPSPIIQRPLHRSSDNMIQLFASLSFIFAPLREPLVAVSRKGAKK
jgi:hypothetical protein